MTAAIIVQARMTSTRLPGKVLMPLAGRPMLACLLERLYRVSLADKVIVATTTNATDDVLIDFCQTHGVTYYRGPEHDVLARYAGAAEENSVDTIIRVTSDCPLLEPQLVEDVIAAFKQAKGNVDYVSNMIEPTYPYGMAVEVFSRDVLQQTYREAKDPAEREHVTPFIYWRPQRYRLKSIKQDRDLSHHRWTVDTPEDYRLVKLIYEAVYPSNPQFDTTDVLNILDQNPEWLLINRHIEQKNPNQPLRKTNDV